MPSGRAQQRQDGAQRIAPPVGAGAVVEGAYIVAQPPAESLGDRLVVAVDDIATGEVAVRAIRSEDALPVLRRARPDVAQPLGARCHALLEGFGKGGERRLAELQRLEPREREGEVDRNRIPLLLDLVAVPLQPCFDGLAAQLGGPDDPVLRSCLGRRELSEQFVGELLPGGLPTALCVPR